MQDMVGVASPEPWLQTYLLYTFIADGPPFIVYK
jgi:hypothetical protein